MNHSRGRLLAARAMLAGVFLLGAHGAVAADARPVVTQQGPGGEARFVKVPRTALSQQQAQTQSPAAKAEQFLAAHGQLFGIRAAAEELTRVKEIVGPLGATAVRYDQRYQGVPVFGARLMANIDRDGALQSVNGTFVPALSLNTTPRLQPRRAAKIAAAAVAQQLAPRNLSLSTVTPTLYVMRKDLHRGINGGDHLVFEVEVGNGADVREMVYVDAHTGKIVEQFTGIFDALNRRVYDGGFGAGFLVWSEGQATPFGVQSIDDLISVSEDTYNFYASMSAGTFLSWDGADGIMHAANNDPAITCPNAQWAGTYIRFCDGTSSDDVVGHEWSHAYTQSTHGLIYAWQSGALNEAYSDIFGEAIDLLNGYGSDAPGALRTAGECSVFGGSAPPSFTVTAPAAIAGGYAAAGANFNPSSGSASGSVVYAQPNEACSAITNGGAVSGSIALIDRGNCPFVDKATNALNAGAIGVIIANQVDDSVFTMGGAGTLSIPSVMIGLGDGATIKGQLGSVTADIALGGASDSTLRWLMGEDAPAFGGSIRDMWNPNCYGDPGKVSDTQYFCSDADSGGVHSNSGVINHGFALLVDGGSYNGQAIGAIGLTKAAHLYWRTATNYQTPFSNFFDHADALEAACSDFVVAGTNLPALTTNATSAGLSGEVFNATDCANVAAAIAAIELRTAPTQCGFTALLDKNPPALCGAGTSPQAIESNDFEAGLGSWSAGRRAIANSSTFDAANFAAVGDLPMSRAGNAAFGADLITGDCGADTEAGVIYLQSPAIAIAAGLTAPRLVFDHYVATETDWDGANVKVSVNGGAYQLVPASAFLYNAYNGTLNASDNPMGGEAAFHGADQGSLTGSWGQSQIDLTGIAGAGDSVQFRFELGTDGCNGLIGWYIDDAQLYSCEVAADSDGDGVSDALDNCTNVPNALQQDSNGDGYGNICDADLDNNLFVDFLDLGIMKQRFFSNDADADLNSDGFVDFLDLGLVKQSFFGAPGPSGIAP